MGIRKVRQTAESKMMMTERHQFQVRLLYRNKKRWFPCCRLATALLGTRLTALTLLFLSCLENTFVPPSKLTSSPYTWGKMELKKFAGHIVYCTSVIQNDKRVVVVPKIMLHHFVGIHRRSAMRSALGSSVRWITVFMYALQSVRLCTDQSGAVSSSTRFP